MTDNLADISIEIQLVGAVFTSADLRAFDAVTRKGISEETFTDGNCRALFSEGKRQADECGKLDILSAARKAKTPEDFLRRVIDGAGMAAFSEAWADSLIELQRRREERRVFSEGLAKLKSGNWDAASIRATAEEGLFSIGQDAEAKGGTLEALIGEAVAEARERETGGVLKTGIGWLDNAIGPLAGGRVYIVSGGAGSGKTTLTRDITANLIRGGHRVSFLTLELPKRELLQWMISADAGIRMRELAEGNPEAVARFETAAKNWGTLPLAIEGGPMDTAGFRSWIRREASRGSKLAIVDYLQLLQPERGGRYDSTERETAAASNAILQAALSSHLPIIAIASESNMGTLRNSGQIEYDCACHIKLAKREDGTGPTVTFPKIRHGGAFNGSGIELYFTRGHLSDVDPEATNFRK